MNVLIFVSTMLMLLTLMTYAKLETYRNSQVFQVLFEHYAQKDERGQINLAAETTYDNIKKTAKAEKKEDQPAKGKDKNQPPTPKAQGNARISIYLFKTKSQRESKPQEWQQAKTLLKNLMINLYKDQPFFIEMEKKRPQFLDEIINGLTQASDELPKERKWKKAQDIANTTLGDRELDHVLYLMGKGAAYKEVVNGAPQQAASEPKTPIEESDEASDPSEQNEYKSPKGYYSLFDFITLSTSQKIRVYLTPKEVLRTIYNSDQIANDIMAERKQLYNQAKNGGDTTALTKNFQEKFDSARDPALSKDTLDYTVTKTNPNKYE